jgi:predicted Zn-dependent protease
MTMHNFNPKGRQFAAARRHLLVLLAGGATMVTAKAAMAQFGFNFGSSSDSGSGSSLPGINLNNLFSGVKSLFDGLTMGEADEIRIGETLYPRFIDRMGGAYRNRRLQTSLRNFAEGMFKTTARPQLPWEVTLLNDNTVNAWVLPGGKVAVNKGLLRYVNHEAELAAVIGHEIGHAELSHGLSQMRSESFTKGLSSLSREALASQVGSDRLLTDQFIDLLEAPLLEMVTTGYSEDREFEADLHLLKVFEKTGHDPSQAANFFRTLLEIMPRDTEDTTSLFSTHPGMQERIDRIEQAADGLDVSRRQTAGADFEQLKRTFPTRKKFRRRG